MKIIKIERSKVKNLYNLACQDWKDKINDKYKNFFLEDIIEVEESFLLEIKSACNEKQLQEFNKIFKDYLPKDLFDEVSTYLDVCRKLNEDPINESDFKFLSKEDRSKSCTFSQLKQIERLFNGNWKADFKDSNQYKYFPWFKVGHGGLVFDLSYYHSSLSDASVVYFKDEKTSTFVGKTFIDIYKKLY